MKDESKTKDTSEEPLTGTTPASDSSFLTHPSSFHSIRLGPPWQITTYDTGARHTRKFGRPRTLDANERLWLVCEHIPGTAEVRVNDTPVAPSAAVGVFAADITSLLLPRNEVVFVVASGAPLGAVVLEIRPG